MAKRKKTSHKIGSSWITMRKVDGKNRKVKVTKTGKDKEKVHILGAKKARRKKRR